MIVFLPMAFMVLFRDDRRHAFDLMSRSIVIRRRNYPQLRNMEGNLRP